MTLPLNPHAPPFIPHASTPTQSGIKIATLNACSLRYKLPEIASLIRTRQYDILGLSETWLDPEITDGELSIDGYNLIRKDRTQRLGGGVCFYYRQDLPVRSRPDLHSESTETVWVEINGKPGRHLVGCVYRPPGEPVSYWADLEADIVRAAVQSSSVTLVGDFNVNMDPAHPAPQHKHLTDLCAAFGLQNIVMQPTRETPQCPEGTMIDLILTNPALVSLATVVPTDISDHSAVEAFIQLAVDVPPASSTTSRLTRNIRGVDINSFRQDILEASLHDFSDHNDVNHMWKEWHTKFLYVLDKHAPLHNSKPSRRAIPPWSDRELHQLEQRKRRLHSRWRKDRTNGTLYAEFKQARSTARNAYRRKRNEYFSRQCEENVANPRKSWAILNAVTGRSRRRQDPSCSISEVADTFHSIVTDPNRPEQLCTPHGPAGPVSLTELDPVTPADVRRLLEKLDARKATGSDGIPGSLLQQCADLLSYSLAVLFCTSLRTGTIPSAFKLASVVPLYKAGDPSVPTNYRPVSLLPIVSKLLERVVQHQLVRHLDLTQALPETQFAFRKKCSTEDALCVLTDNLQKARDSGKTTGLCLLDMSKAFDKVHHDKLIQDLLAVGISGKALSWFVDYLSGRKQQILISPSTSPALACTCGVPQGSVLGPVLFSIYTRDVPLVSSPVPSVQFADDIALYDSQASAAEASRTLTTAATALAGWLKSRGLILNATKSQVLTISPQQHVQEVTVKSGDCLLPSASSARYLGVHLDNRLDWDTHVNYVVTKVAKKIGALWRARRSLSRRSRQVYVKAVIMPDLLYGSCCFSAAMREGQLKRLQTTQNRAIRCIDGNPPRTAMQPLLTAHSLYRVSELYRQKILITIWRCIHARTSPVLAQLLTPHKAPLPAISSQMAY